MDLNLTTYILFSIIILTIFVIIVILLKYKRLRKEQNKKISEIEKKFDKKITELTGEIKRQNYVIAEYQKQKNLIKTIENESPEINMVTTQNAKNEEYNDLIIEKNKLEKEKEQFKNKTKKLWEQSIAIHKEKERIDGLKKQIERDHQHVTDSIKYAKYIQNALLPLDDYIKSILPDFFILFKPRDIVSGDFYWMKQIENYLIVVAADCTGHGVPGAFMSMLGISSLNEIITKKEDLDAAQILEKLRKIVIHSLHQDDKYLNSRDGMDAAICIINKENYKAQYAGANNPLYIVRNKELIEFKATSSPVAYYLKMREFVNHDFQIQEDDFIYLFSDGYADQFGGETGTKFKSKNFKQLLIEVSQKNILMENISETLYQKHLEWKTHKYQQVDDMLIVGLRF